MSNRGIIGRFKGNSDFGGRIASKEQFILSAGGFYPDYVDATDIVPSSAESVLLMKGAGNGADNEAITFLNSAQSSTNFTEVGTPLASTFSPYRSGGYSVYLDGSGDYLSIADDDSLEFGSGNFTIEAWVYPKAIDSSFSVIVNRWDSGSLKSYIVALTSSAVYFYYSTTGSNQTLLQWSETVPLNEWTHLAIVRNGNDLKLYVNGTAHATTNSISGVTLYGGTSVTKVGILGDLNSGTDFTGYIRDLRLIKGTAQYTSNFSAPTESLTAISGTSLLCCHLPYIADDSTNDHTITVNGNTSTKPFGPYDYEVWQDSDHGISVYFDGNGDYLIPAITTAVGTSDFTLEGWFYPTSTASDTTIFDFRSSGNWGIFSIISTNTVAYYNGSATVGTTSNTVTDNTWNHIAIVRNSGSVKIYINGVLGSTTADTTNWTLAGSPRIGGNKGNTAWMNGHIADVRFISGTAAYTADFTPPTAPVSHTGSNTKLLMNNTDANIYDATGSWVFDSTLGITTNNSTRKWNTSSSIYFDNVDNGLPIFIYGAGDSKERDYWQNEFLVNDFTFEGWFYLNNDNGSNLYFQLGAGGGNWTTSGQQFLLYSANGTFYAQWNNGGGAASSTWSEPSSGAWFHYACVNDSGTLRQFVDGAGVGTDTSFTIDADYVTGGTWTARLGGYTATATYAFDGYMQDVRISKGLARYTTAFTAPASEFRL